MFNALIVYRIVELVSDIIECCRLLVLGGLRLVLCLMVWSGVLFIGLLGFGI